MNALDMWLALKEEPMMRGIAARVMASTERIEDCLKRMLDSLESEGRGPDWKLPYVESQLEHCSNAVESLKLDFSALVEAIVARMPFC